MKHHKTLIITQFNANSLHSNESYDSHPNAKQSIPPQTSLRPPTTKIEAKPSSIQTIISRRFLVRFFTNLEPLRAYLSGSGSVWKMISLPSRRPNRFLRLFRVILKHASLKRIDHMRFLILIIPFLLSAVRHMHMPMQKKLRFVLLH